MTEKFDEPRKLIPDNDHKIYSERVIDHALNPRSLGETKDADGFAKITGPLAIQ